MASRQSCGVYRYGRCGLPSEARLTKLEHALALAHLGFKIFPIKAGAKAPPLVNDWPRIANSSEQYAHAVWNGYDFNIGIHCEGLLVVDVDPAKGGDESFARLDDLLGFPLTRVHFTARGGRHILYRLPEGHPGVPNSVGTEDRGLAPGLDIRSTKGYIVAPGSVVAEGSYTTPDDNPDTLADAPGWLLERLGRTQPKKPTKDVPDAPAEAVERALYWLEGAERSVKGQGGDQTAYRVACQLRDFGLSYDQACEAMRSDAWDMGCGWRDGWLEEKPIASAYRYAQNEEGGTKAQATASMFKISGIKPDNVKNNRQTRLRRARSLESLAPGPELWQGVLPEKAIFAIGALPGRSKSYTATGLCYALATDAGEYIGRKLPTGTAAIYVDVERLSTTELRIAVWAHKDGKDLERLPLLLTDGVRLSEPETTRVLIEDLQGVQAEVGRRVSLVILDSLGALLPGQEMNNSGPATLAGTWLRHIRDTLDCAVGIVAHSPKSGDETVAGSLHFDAIFDTTIFVRSEDGAAGSLYVKKDNGLALEEHERHTHWKRETLTADVGKRTVRVHRLAAGSAPLPGEKPLAGGVKVAYDLLRELTPSMEPIALAKWVDAVIVAGRLPERTSKSFRQRWFDLKKALRGKVEIDEDNDIVKRSFLA